MLLVLVHNNDSVTSILDEVLQPISRYVLGHSVPKTLKQVAKKSSNVLVVWCHEMCIENLNIKALNTIFHHQRILASFNPTDTNYFPEQLGYIDRSFYLKVNKEVTYPTWLMSSCVGGINTEVLKNIDKLVNYNVSFDYFLISLAKRAMVQGLFCYSEPKLLLENESININLRQASKAELFKFVKQHYKWVWIVFLSWCYAIFERKPSVGHILKSFFYKQLKSGFNLEEIDIKSTKKLVLDKTIDVVIPTIGRKKYLFDVLNDIASQTHLPKNVIIVEQNPQLESVSELDYLKTENWPFKIKHTFTNQPGVCNARNIALSQVESEWTFLADDDIRFNTTFFEDSFSEINKNGLAVLNYVCLQPNQKQTYFKLHQTTVFGSGSSMVKSSSLKDLKFNIDYEFGFGEDSEFGMQLRNKGTDVIYIPNLKITHLKAPMGGYRTKIKQRWEDDKIQPKPSPTIQLLYQTYFVKRQLEGYKLLLFLKQLKSNGLKNPVAFAKQFKKQWQQSVVWSQKLKQN